jgi:ATP-binding cassette subfamily B protein
VQYTESTTELFTRLWHHISRRRRWQFALLLLLMVLSSFAEIVSIGAVLPFLGVITTPELVYENKLFQPIIYAMGLAEPRQLIFPLTFAFAASALIAGALKLTLLWASTRLSFATGADLSFSIYRRTLYQPYSVHCVRNSSEVITGISTKANSVIYSIIFPAVNMVSATILLTTILIVLFKIDQSIALVSFGGFGFIYAIVISLTRQQLSLDSHKVALESNKVIKSLQEGLGGIRDILLDRSQAVYCEIYRKSDLQLRRAQGSTMFIGHSPRYAVEALGMVLIAGIIYSLSQQSNGIAQSIPILGALAMGAQRLIPILQQFYVSWSQIKGSQASLRDTLELLDQPLPDYTNHTTAQTLHFRRAISLKQLSFQYGPETPLVL